MAKSPIPLALTSSRRGTALHGRCAVLVLIASVLSRSAGGEGAQCCYGQWCRCIGQVDRGEHADHGHDCEWFSKFHRDSLAEHLRAQLRRACSRMTPDIAIPFAVALHRRGDGASEAVADRCAPAAIASLRERG